jgi:hypothetical protein
MTNILLYVIKHTSPPLFAAYEVNPFKGETEIVYARARIEERHPEYNFIGVIKHGSLQEAKDAARGFNAARVLLGELFSYLHLTGKAHEEIKKLQSSE